MISHQHGNNLQGIRQSCNVRCIEGIERGEMTVGGRENRNGYNLKEGI
jgi:hypothetical protein